MENEDGSFEDLKIGSFQKKIGLQQAKRALSPLRALFSTFDDMYIGNNERILLGNIKRFRSYLRELIIERKEEMKLPDFK